MIPPWPSSASPFTSGTTRAASGSMRKAEELSITTAPLAAAAGANRRETAASAANSTRSDPARPSSLTISTVTSSPRNLSFRPAERWEANRRSSATGNRRVSRQAIISRPTAPVAPTMATLAGAVRRADGVRGWRARAAERAPGMGWSPARPETEPFPSPADPAGALGAMLASVGTRAHRPPPRKAVGDCDALLVRASRQHGAVIIAASWAVNLSENVR